MPDQSISEWGAVMRLARAASMLATENERKAGRITDPEESSIMLYTDDPTTAVLFAANLDMAVMCKTSHIEAVATIMGKDFPPDAFEAPRHDMEMPRVAAMCFPPIGSKCGRCRRYTAAQGELCKRCKDMIDA